MGKLRYFGERFRLRAGSSGRGAAGVPAAVCALLLGCGSSADRALTRDDTVVIAYCCRDEVLSPAHDMNAKLLVFETLLRRNADGELEGRLARRWEPSPDYREWTYHLRTDVRWHDGVPFTANDVAFTIALMRAYADLDYGGDAFESVTVRDDSTVTIRSGRGRRLYQEWMVFYPRHILADQDPAGIEAWDFWRAPIGNGPYRVVSLDAQSAMTLEANPDFYRGAPSIGRVILKFSNDAGPQELLSGAVDAASRMAGPRMRAVLGDPRFATFHEWYDASWVIFWNSVRAPFDDPRVRRALTLGIDRSKIPAVLDLPGGMPLPDGPFTPDQLRRGELPDPIPFDTAQASSLLDVAGWRDTDGDGIRDRDGAALRFTLLSRTESSEDLPGVVDLAVFVESELRRVGVVVEIQPLDPAVVRDRIDAGEFDAAIHWFRPYEAPWMQMFGIGAGPPLGYRNDRVVELIEQADRTWVPEEEDRIYRELAEIFQRDVPMTALHLWSQTWVVHRRLRGLNTPWRADPVAAMDALLLKSTEGGA